MFCSTFWVGTINKSVAVTPGSGTLIGVCNRKFNVAGISTIAIYVELLMLVIYITIYNREIFNYLG
ncbi:hypothetical protein DSM106972_061950 [Dulcicalothrix desertica PCC 7102]|uniref:Uncharacterized protein n=1 Tax=Dulcicalothrix desertica PCC 7102 TaxID=232991 RepID=A0A3S1D1Z0_9CYAN|nr:hypothetical protein DSM106972_061950 [Dulcicalothrix desertica PCC 7102]